MLPAGNYMFKVNNKDTKYRDVSRTPTTPKMEIFQTLVHGSKLLINVIKKTIPDVLRVLEGPRFLWNIIYQCKLISKI